MKQTIITERFTKPNRFDAAPYGTVVEYKNEGVSKKWIQVSKNLDHGTAEWIEEGEFILVVLRQALGLNDFISECLDIYSGEKTLPASNLRYILGELKDEENNSVDL